MSRRAGFSLVEVVISVALLSLVILSAGTAMIRLSGKDSETHARTGQVTALRRTMAYWATVPYASLPAAGTQTCDTVAVAVRVRTCAAATSLTIGTTTGRRLTLTAAALQGAPILPDSTILDRVPDS